MFLTLDPTVNIGNVVTIIFAFAATIGAWYKVRGRLDIIEYRVKAVEDTLTIVGEALKAIANADTQMALLNQRQSAVETLASTLAKEVADLRRGEGFIQGPRRGNVDGEYPPR